MFKKALIFVIGTLLTSSVMGTLKTEPVDYTANGDSMEGYVAYDDAIKPKGAILVVPDWMGLGQFAKDKADKLAKEGYVAFAVDVYGKGVRPKDNKEAAQLATKYKDDRKLLRSHMQAAYDKLTSMNEVDPKKVLVMGYCFGGTAALELARAGAPLVGTAVFHGGLASPTPDDAKNIKGPVLVMQGADDPVVPPKEVEAFKEEMKNGNVNLTFIAYPGAVHAYTNPLAGNDNSKGVAYNANADKKSWKEFEKFLKKVF
jgi:dienelactone hydrolase